MKGIRLAIVAAADGSALGNPGPAGWAWFVNENQWKTGGWNHATNNQAELMAVLSLLNETQHITEPLTILCDSKYVIDSLTKWLPGWKRKGWRKADGKPVLNRDLFESLDAALSGRTIRFEWVKGHSGHPMNEKVDEIARNTALAFQRGDIPFSGPGYSDKNLNSDDESTSDVPKSIGCSEPLSLFTDVSDDQFIAPKISDLGSQGPDPISTVSELEYRSLEIFNPGISGLLHPDYREVNLEGSPIAHGAQSGSFSSSKVSIQDARLVTPGVVILTVTSQLTQEPVDEEHATLEPVVWSSVWVEHSGDWLLSHRHMSRSQQSSRPVIS